MNFSDSGECTEKVLSSIGNSSIEELFSQIPADLRFPDMGIENGLDEYSLKKRFAEIEEKNRTYPANRSFCGAGHYSHYIPAAVDSIASMGSFATAYTPYQPEVSQGTLQYLFEYQSYIAELSRMDVVNASHYDGATAFAEALRMMYEANKKRGNRLLIWSKLSPEYSEIINTYLQFTSAEIEYRDVFEAGSDLEIPADCAAVSIVLPDFHGRVFDLNRFAGKCGDLGVLLHVHADPLLLSCITPPGSLGADVYTGEGQVLGSPIFAGGPYLGIFAVKQKLLRRMPGRISGETVDKYGMRGFVLALSTREQHIKREKASSNICTNQGLMALRAICYMAFMGREGLSAVARTCISNVHYIIERLSELPGISVLNPNELHFREVLVHTDRPVQDFLVKGAALNIIPGIEIDEHNLLISTTELHSREDLGVLISLITEVSSQ